MGIINEIAGKSNDKSTVINCIKVDAIDHYDSHGITNALGKYFATVGETYAKSISQPSNPVSNYISKIPQNQKKHIP